MSIDALQSKIRKIKSPIIVGLDPTPELIPPTPGSDDGSEALAARYTVFCKTLLDALQETVPAVKLQSACFSALGWQGVKAMQELLAYAKNLGYYVLLETMRSDLGHIAELTANSVFGGLDCGDTRQLPYPCDGLVLNGYLGSDSITPFRPWLTAEEPKNLFVVVKSSNRSSSELQDLISGDRVVYRAMADLVLRWNRERRGACGYGEIGAVVGAQSLHVVQELRKSYDSLFFLVPGCGAQGCPVKYAAAAFDRMGHGAALCVSRSVLGAWRDKPGVDYPAAAVQAVEKLKNQLSLHVTVL
ncbi:MAG: orotidine-5'-phosphate decarboxylase [Oscillospiraceae bacterium]|nr:orotidine-5'-phosphate decarboxylase [Oscillospiraceae bacterium]